MLRDILYIIIAGKHEMKAKQRVRSSYIEINLKQLNKQAKAKKEC